MFIVPLQRMCEDSGKMFLIHLVFSCQSFVYSCFILSRLHIVYSFLCLKNITKDNCIELNARKY